MTEIPRRPSLVGQVAEILRKGLKCGEWAQRLPAERFLSRQLQVSRPTLRAALKLLCREGLVEMKHGQRTQIRSPSRSRITRRISGGISRRIGVLSCQHPESFSSSSGDFFRHLELQLRVAGFEMNWYVELNADSRGAHQRLGNLLSRSSHAGWLLVACPSQIQRLFKKAGVPALILGTCHPGIHLPCIDVDYQAVCRHAAQTFLGYGHQRIVMLAPKGQLAGDLVGQQAFEQVLSSHSQAQLKPPFVVRHDGTVDDILRTLDRLFRSQHPPTALFICLPLHALTVATGLLGKGFRLPADVSIICRDTDDFLRNMIPPLSCYVCDTDVFVNRHVRAVIQLVNAGTLASKSVLIMPEFIKGATLAHPRSRA